MLSNLSNTNNGNEASNHVIENKCYECLEEQIDEIKQKNNEQDVSISNNTSNIDALKYRVCAVECNRTFDNILVNCIRPKTSARVTIDGNLTARNVTASTVTADALSVNGTSFVSVANRSEMAITDAVTARCCANAAATCAQNANTRVTNLENSLACCVVTDCVNATGSINVNNTITSSDVCTSDVYANESDIGEIFTGKITANGQLPLPSAGANWYTITIPDGVTVNLTSKYIAENNTEYKWRVIVTDTQVSYKNEGSSIKDISYNRAGNTKVRVRASEDISYIRLANNAANEITIQSLGNAYNDYAYTPEKAAGTVFRGYNDRTTEVIQPGYLCATVIRGDAIEYCENTTECMTVTCKLFLPDEWSRTGMICRSSGADNQYLSNDTKDETISPTWKTPVECAVDGKLSNTKCLITEKAVSEYNGTVTDGTNDSYPISELNCCTCVHGTLNGECICASDLVESCHGCFTCNMRAYEACSRWTHTDVVTSLDQQPDSAIVFQSCTINACPSFFNAPSCFCDTIRVDCNADFGSNVHIAGDLFVSGTSHVVDEETIETPSNEIVLRQNASVGLANSEISGIVVNKYNGSDSLTVGADNTGTLRVGTGTGTTTCYANICHNQTDNKWYLSDSTEVTPVGILQSYATKVEEDPYTVYTDAVFMAVDKTSLEPVLTRDEETDLTQCGILYWDATNTKAKNASKIKYNNNGLDLDGKTCISAECTTITDGTNTTVIDASSVTSNCGCFVNATADEVCGVCCVTTPLACMCCALADNITTECSVCVKGDLIVCGNAAIAGLMSDCVATVQTNPYDVAFYPTFVSCNYAVKGSSEIFTDCNLCYYPSHGSLCTNCVYANDYIYANCAYIPSAQFDCARTGSLCVGTIGNYNLGDSANFKLYGISNTNFDFAMPIYSSQECQLLNCNTSKLAYNCCGGPTYNPYTCTLKVPNAATGCIEATNANVCCSLTANDITSNDSLTVCGNANVCCNLAVDGTVTASSNLTVCRNAGICCNLTVGGTITGTVTKAVSLSAVAGDVPACSARLWSSSIPDSYALVANNCWRHYLSMSHGSYTTYYGLSIAMPFMGDERFLWRVRRNGTLCPIHELLDNRGGQVIKGDTTICDHSLILRGTTSATIACNCPKIVFQDYANDQSGCLIFTDYDAYLPGASLTFITDQNMSWFCSQYAKFDSMITCNLRVFHNQTSTSWQSVAKVAFGAGSGQGTDYSIIGAACPDANGLDVSFGQGDVTLIFGGDGLGDTNTFISKVGRAEKVVLASDSNATDIVGNMNGGFVCNCTWKWCFNQSSISRWIYNGTSFAQEGIMHLGSNSIAIGQSATWDGSNCQNTVVGASAYASKFSTSVGYGAKSCCISSTALGSCTLTYGGVSVGYNARSGSGTSVGHSACSCNGIAIGGNSYSCYYRIAIGCSSEAIDCGCAFTDMDMRVPNGGARFITFRWSTSTKQCDLYCAIMRRVNFTGALGTIGNANGVAATVTKKVGTQIQIGCQSTNGFVAYACACSSCTANMTSCGLIGILAPSV